MQLKAQLLSSHLPHKLAQTAQTQVANLTGRLLYLAGHSKPYLVLV